MYLEFVVSCIRFFFTIYYFIGIEITIDGEQLFCKLHPQPSFEAVNSSGYVLWTIWTASLFALFSFWLLDCFQRSELKMRANALCSRKAHVALAHHLREVLRRRYVGGDKASRATALRHAYVTWRILRHRSCPYRLQLRSKKLIILSNNKASNVKEK